MRSCYCKVNVKIDFEDLTFIIATPDSKEVIVIVKMIFEVLKTSISNTSFNFKDSGSASHGIQAVS
jgi:hypothetical protein